MRKNEMMKHSLMALVAGLTLATGIPTASAADAYELDAAQMDQVTAGLTRSLDFSFDFTVGASLLDNIPGFGDDAVVTALLIDETREGIDPDTGTAFTSTISSSSFGVRGSSTRFFRTGSFQTTVIIGR